jgi:hypothetical protein
VKFEEALSQPAVSGDAFGGTFVLPGESGAAGAQPDKPAPDSSRKLIQVAGGEQINLFLRIDVLQFLPAKELPKS